MGFEGSRATARTLMKEGDTAVRGPLVVRAPGAPETYDEAYERLVWTAHHWQHWLDHGEFPDHPWRTYLQRSALTLKGLSYAPTGAMVAAATTSLPETPGGERNWDYRYTWIRDATFMLWGLYTLGFDWEANDFFYFIADVAEAEEGQLQIMYGIGGEAELDGEHARPPDGYEGARPVRIGNGAYDQDQHDVWGALPRLDLPAHEVARPPARARSGRSSSARWRRRSANWREPDRGIWEVRGEPEALHVLEADVLGGARPRRPAGRAARGRRDARREWQSAADEIHADICDNALDDRGVFCQHYETDALDASVLLMPLVRFLPPERRAHPRHRAGDRRRADRGRARAALPDRRDRRRARRRGGHLHDLLVLAGVRAGRDRRDRAGRALCEKLLSLREPARALRRGDRPPLGPPPRATSPRPSPTWR